MAMFKSVFKGDSWQKQEVIASLVTYIGSGISNEVAIALEILKDLTENCTMEVLGFVVFIKNIFDCRSLNSLVDLDNLNLSNIRVLFGIFATLASFEGTTDQESLLGSELNMFVRKQLSSPLECYKKVGVIATLCMVERLGDGAAQESIIESVRLLDFLLDQCKASPVLDFTS